VQKRDTGEEVQLARVTPDTVDELLAGKGAPHQAITAGEPLILLRRVGKIDPTDLAAFEDMEGFFGLRAALGEMTPEAVIEQVKLAGIKGRGGAGFPTGLKWQFTRGAADSPKYVVANADESEPGTFKDRVLMEGDPFRLLEGMAICAYAIGAEHGYIFIRGEYPRARRVLEEAIERASAAGYLGQNILNSGFNFAVEIRQAAGAYICGEETALFEAIEGRRGYPRIKPPFPTTHGLFSRPTCINNVETLCAVPDIVYNGGEWYLQFGTGETRGTKLFCVSGHVKRPGVIEAPFGIPLRRLINDYCGGVEGELGAILMGGAAGNFMTPDQLDTPLTAEDLSAAGAALGSGAIMIFNTTIDLREVLVRLGHFFMEESCGKCYPCQLGTMRQYEILKRLAEGHPLPGDRQRLLDIGQTMSDASLCGLGQTAAWAVLSALRHWPEMAPA
jgi:NADH-quinone oxidoreductase subunit F